MNFSNRFGVARNWLDEQAIRLQAWSGFSRRGLLLFACSCGAVNSLLVFLVPHIDDTLRLNFYAFFIFANNLSVYEVPIVLLEETRKRRLGLF